MPTAGETTTNLTLDFAAANQSMWASGPALTVNYSLPIVTIPTISFSKSIAGISLSAYFGAQLVANVNGSAGSVTVDYPVSGTITAPTTVAPGEQFTVGTTNSGLISGGATISTGFPTLSASLDLDVSGGVAASGSISLLGVTVPTFSVASSFDQDLTVVSAKTSGSASVSFPYGTATFTIPTSETNPGGTTVVNGGSALKSISAFETTSSTPVFTVSTNLADDLGSLLGLEDFPSGSFVDGAVSYNLLSAPLTGSLSLVQDFSFIPAGVSVDITAPWGQSVVVPLGSKATFTVPVGWTGNADLTTQYVLSGNLESQNGIAGTVGLKLSFLSISAFGYSAGPAYTHSFSVGTGPIYLYTPGGSTGFPLDNIALSSGSTVANTVDVGLGPETITVPHGGTVDLAGFSGDAIPIIQAGVNQASGTSSATNLYNGSSGKALSGSPTSVSGELNIELTNRTGTVQLPNGFALGILEPGSANIAANATLVGNATDVLLAAVPNSGQVDTLSSTNSHDTLVGAQNGRVDFAIKSGFGGEVAGLAMCDAIDVQNAPWVFGATAVFNSANSTVSLIDGVHTYTIKLDPVENFANQVFSVMPDLASGTDIYFGNVVGSGTQSGVIPGSVESNVLVLSGGSFYVSDGAKAVNVTLSGGAEYVSAASAVSTTVLSGGFEGVSAGGVAVSTTVDAHGGLQLEAGGVASATVVNSLGVETILSGGTDTGATINSGGDQSIYAHGTANKAVVSAHGSQFVYNGALASSATIGGYQTVSGGTATATHVLSGGTETVFSGGTGAATTVSAHGSLLVSSGGTATTAKLASGVIETVFSGGETLNTTASAGASIVVSSGGTAFDPQLAVSTTLTVRSGGLVSRGFTSGRANISGSAMLFGVDSSGTEWVSSGGVTVSSFVNNGGAETLSKGASAQDTQIQFGGLLVVGAGATATATSDGGTESVYGVDTGGSFGTVSSTDFPMLTVFSGGTLEDPALARRVDALVRTGGTVVSPDVESAATLELQSGAALSGSVDMIGGTLQIDAKTMPTNTISGFFSQDGNTIDMRGVAPVAGATVSVVSGTELQISGGGKLYQFTISQTGVPSSSNHGLPQDGTIQLAPDGHKGTELSILGGGSQSIAAPSDATLYTMPNDTVGAVFASSTTIHAMSDTTIYGGPNDTIYLTSVTAPNAGSVIFNPLASTISTGAHHSAAAFPVVHDTVVGFQLGIDEINFPNNTASTVSAVLGNSHVSGGNTYLKFSDGSTITLSGFTQLSAGIFK